MKKEKITLPNLIIAGVNKSGTTSLFHALNEHPEFCGSSVKETQYFLPSAFGKKILPLAEYSNYFLHHQSEKIIFEATPGYFVGGKSTATLIHQTLPDIKIIVVLRNPAERLISFFRSKKLSFELDENISLTDYVSMCVDCEENKLSLQKNNYLSGVQYGCYMNYLPDWIKVFEKNLKIIFFEDLVHNPHEVLKNICKWLGTDATFFNDFEFPQRNKSFAYRNKFVHQVATTANAAGKNFLNRYPAFKSYMTKTYLSINSHDSEVETLETDRIRIDALYKDHNSLLREFLLKHDVARLPHWLQS